MSTILNIKEVLDTYFEEEEQQFKEIFNQLTLYIYSLESQQSHSDLFILAKLLPDKYLKELINYYDGDIIKMPSKDEFKRAYLIAFCFFLKEIKGWNWIEIKEFLPCSELDEEVSSISIGRRINQIKENLDKELLKLLLRLKGNKP